MGKKEASYEPLEDAEKKEYDGLKKEAMDALEDLSKSQRKGHRTLDDFERDYNFEDLKPHEQEVLKKELYRLVTGNKKLREQINESTIWIEDEPDAPELKERLREVKKGYRSIDTRVRDMAQRAGILLEGFEEMMYG